MKRLSRSELEKQIWNADPDIAFRDVCADDFDLLEIKKYNRNGNPCLDEFEYLDADYHNDAVWERYREFLDWQRQKAMNKPEEG